MGVILATVNPPGASVKLASLSPLWTKTDKMNSLFLIASTLVIYFFGYRYFARYLHRKVFRLPVAVKNPAAPDTSIVKQIQNASSVRHEMLGFHFAAITTLTAISGASVALFWGWVPAYLWLLVGSSVAAGTFAIGSLWLRRQDTESQNEAIIGTGLIPIVTQTFHRRLGPTLLVLLVIALIIFSGLFFYFAAILLVSFPATTWPILVTLLVVGLLSRVLANQNITVGERLPSYLVGFIVVLLSIWITRGKTLGFSGSLNFDISGQSLVSIDGIAVWGVLTLLFALFVQRKPFDDWQKTLGVLTTFATIFLMVLFYIGLVIRHPVMSAPTLTGANSPGILPWLFITLSSGAYAGLHFLFAYSVTGPRINHDEDVTYIGYGAALLEGLVGLSVVVVFGALLGNKDVWLTLYQSWPALPDGAAMLGHYVNGVIIAGSQLGISNEFMETYTALVLTSLSLVSAISLLRVLRVLLQELGARYKFERLGRVKTASWTGFLLIFIAVLATNASTNIKVLEQLLGATQYLLASIGLLLIIAAMTRNHLGVIPAWALLSITVVIALVADSALILSWYRHFQPTAFLAGILLLTIQLALLGDTAHTLWKRRTPPAQPSPPAPSAPENTDNP
jgi:carbon starvation protein